MSGILVTILYFIRPVSYGLFQIHVMGLNFLEFFAVMSLGIFVLLGLTNAARIRLTTIDLVIFGFMVWCIGAYFAYIDKSQVADLAKFLLPFLTYVVLKNSIHSRQQFLKAMWVMIIGLAMITAATAVLIAAHKGIYKQDFWTGIYRFTGVYPNPHDLGHSMTFLLMIMAIYATLWQTTFNRRLPVWRIVVIAITTALGMYCLYKSYVRTAYIGLVIFAMVYLFLYNRKLFVMAGSALAVMVVSLWGVWSLIFYDVVNVVEGTRDVDRIASGRPFIWKHNLAIFENLSFDRKLAGVGIGNRSHVLGARGRVDNDNVWNSHNDFLDVMMQTGVVGFILFMIVQFMLMWYVWKLKGPDKCAFVAFFVAVAAMNFASNSYVSRFGLGQMFYMIIIFAEAVVMGTWASNIKSPAEQTQQKQIKPWGVRYARTKSDQATSPPS